MIKGVYLLIFCIVDSYCTSSRCVMYARDDKTRTIGFDQVVMRLRFFAEMVQFPGKNTISRRKTNEFRLLLYLSIVHACIQNT